MENDDYPFPAGSRVRYAGPDDGMTGIVKGAEGVVCGRTAYIFHVQFDGQQWISDVDCNHLRRVNHE